MVNDVQVCDTALDDVVRHAVDGVLIIDRNGEVVYFSKGCERITGVDSAAVLGARCACFNLTECRDDHERSLSGALCPGQKVLDGELPFYRQRLSTRHSDGHRVWVETTYSPIEEKNGDLSGVVAIMRDVTQAKEREDELRALAGLEQARLAEEAPSVCDASRGVTEESKALPETNGKMGPLDRILTTIERREILTALKRTGGQRTHAARLLGISRSRLYRRMEALGIDPRRIDVNESA